MSRFRYSEKAWLPLWLIFILCWSIVVASREPEGFDFLGVLFAGFGVLTLLLLAFLFVLDLIEWRWPGK